MKMEGKSMFYTDILYVLSHMYLQPELLYNKHWHYNKQMLNDIQTTIVKQNWHGVFKQKYPSWK